MVLFSSRYSILISSLCDSQAWGVGSPNGVPCLSAMDGKKSVKMNRRRKGLTTMNVFKVVHIYVADK
jgi:hypothetical protein